MQPRDHNQLLYSCSWDCVFRCLAMTGTCEETSMILRDFRTFSGSVARCVQRTWPPTSELRSTASRKRRQWRQLLLAAGRRSCLWPASLCFTCFPVLRLVSRCLVSWLEPCRPMHPHECRAHVKAIVGKESHTPPLQEIVAIQLWTAASLAACKAFFNPATYGLAQA